VLISEEIIPQKKIGSQKHGSCNSREVLICVEENFTMKKLISWLKWLDREFEKLALKVM